MEEFFYQLIGTNYKFLLDYLDIKNEDDINKIQEFVYC